MPKSHDLSRQNRIRDEVIPDCRDEDEQMMSWYYYMADNLEFPIEASVRFRLRGGGEEIKKVKILDVDSKSENGKPIRFGISEGKSERLQTISPEEIASLDTSDENSQIINDWLYWHNFDLLPK